MVKEVLIIKVFRGAMDGKHTLVSLWNMIQLTDEGIALNYEIRDVTFFWETELTNSHPHWFVVGPEYSESMVIIVIEQLLMNCHNFRVENN